MSSKTVRYVNELNFPPTPSSFFPLFYFLLWTFGSKEGNYVNKKKNILVGQKICDIREVTSFLRKHHHKFWTIFLLYFWVFFFIRFDSLFVQIDLLFFYIICILSSTNQETKKDRFATICFLSKNLQKSRNILWYFRKILQQAKFSIFGI